MGEGRQAAADAIAGALRGLAATAEDLHARSVQLAPLEEGELRASALVSYVVDGDRFDGAGALEAATARARRSILDGRTVHATAEVSFNTVYAARQHEELTWHHPIAGQAKYLEQPLLEQAGRYMRIVELSAKLAVSSGS